MSAPIKTLVEKPSIEESPSNLAILGRYVLPTKLLKHFREHESRSWWRNTTYRCTVELLKSNGLNALETDAEIYDCGNKQGFLTANLAMGMRDNETREHRSSGL